MERRCLPVHGAADGRDERKTGVAVTVAAMLLLLCILAATLTDFVKIVAVCCCCVVVAVVVPSLSAPFRDLDHGSLSLSLCNNSNPAMGTQHGKCGEKGGL